MPCDTIVRRNQTLTERKEEVKRTVDNIGKGLVSGRFKIKVGSQGAVAFQDIPESERNGVTDACIYRRLMVSGSATAKMAIMRAELAAGRKIDPQVVAQGIHSHDGGNTWHGKG